MERYVQFSLMLLSMVDVSTTQQSFSLSPQNTTVFVGQTANLRCAVENQIGTVYWEHDGADIQSDGNSGKFQLNENFGSGEYDLTITGASPGDTGPYRCKVTDNTVRTGYRKSDPAYLKVFLPPEDDFPLCFQSIVDVREGDLLTLTCACRRDALDLDLSWVRGNEPVSNGGSIYNYGNVHVVKTFTFAVTSDDDSAVYSCIASSATLGSRRSCTPGPLSVIFPPKVSVQPALFYAYLGDDVLLRCDAVGNPEIQGYQWFYNGHDAEALIGEKFLLEDNGQIFIIRDVNDNDQRATVTCKADNAVGSTTTEGGISIINLGGSEIRWGWLIAAIILAIALIIIIVYTIRECLKPPKTLKKPREIKMWAEGGSSPYKKSEKNTAPSRRTKPTQVTDTAEHEVHPMEILESSRYSKPHTEFFEEIHETHIGEVTSSPPTDLDSPADDPEEKRAVVQVHRENDDEPGKSLQELRQTFERRPDGAESPVAVHHFSKKHEKITAPEELTYADLDFDYMEEKRKISHEAFDSGFGVDSTPDAENNLNADKTAKAIPESVVYAEVKKPKLTKKVTIISKDSTEGILY